MHQSNSRGKTRLDTRMPRVALACLSCRSSKTRCNGEDPCSRCKDRGVMCVQGTVRKKASRRKPKDASGSAPVLSVEGHLGNAGPRTKVWEKPTMMSTPSSDVLDREVHCSVSASDASVTSSMNLIYGPSSTFVFMQQLHGFFSDRQGVDERLPLHAISELGYNDVFFGTEPSPAPAITDLDSLPFDKAAAFMEMYLSTIHYVLPFCEQATLRLLIYNVYSSSDINGHRSNSRDATLVMAVLAIGATLTDESLLAESLYQTARSNIGRWGHSVSLRSVQILMLLSSFEQLAGRPNSAWLTAGSAVHKALAAGLHRDLAHSDAIIGSSEHDMSRGRERQTTFWSLYAHERNLSLPLGRPVSINDLDVHIPEPSYNKYLQASVDLARISQNVSDNYNRTRGASVAEICIKVRDSNSKLSLFHKSLPPELQFPLSRIELQNSSTRLETSQFIMAVHFFHLMLIALRPCQIIDAIRRKSLEANSEFLIPSELHSWLDESCTLCRTAATHIVYLYSDAIKSNPIISRMRFSRFYIEAASFVLLFDLLRDPTTTKSSKGFTTIAEAIQCFTKIPADKVLLISTMAISKMLDLTQELISKPRVRKMSSNFSLERPSDALDSRGKSLSDSLHPPTHQIFESADQGHVASETLNNVSTYDILDMTYYLWRDDDLSPTYLQ